MRVYAWTALSGFHHEAVFYSGDADYLAGMLPDIRGALGAGGRVLAAVADDKAELLRAALGGDAELVTFVDMAELGRNPARIIPAWRDFLQERADGPTVGIGEPVWPGRTPAELVECRRHESLLNLAFDGGAEWRLLCPYDARALDPAVLADARHNHPYVTESGASRQSGEYVTTAAMLAWDGPLPAPAAEAAVLEFTPDHLHAIRDFISGRAAGVLPRGRASDLVLAVNELATNTIRHGGGRGLVRTWSDNGTLFVEVADGGYIEDPLAGRERPPDLTDGGRGLWLVNHLCDLVQVRSSMAGSIVRLHMSV